jgi:DNA-directed RNA polymerase sigma subunit (sigma70/sigma32)
VPDAVRERAAEVRRCEAQLPSRLGRPPETAEVARSMCLAVSEVEEARAALHPVASLDEPVGGEVQLAVADVVADADAIDPVESIVRDE